MKLKKRSYLFIFYDIIVITLSFLFFIWLKPATISFYLPRYTQPFIFFSLIWIGTSLIFNKYTLNDTKKVWSLFYNIIKINIFIFAIIAILIYLFQTFYYSRLIVLGSIITISAFELLFTGLYFAHKKVSTTDLSYNKIASNIEVLESIQKIDPIDNNYDYSLSKVDNEELSAYYVLKDGYLKKYPDLFYFIDNNVPIKQIPKAEIFVLNTATIYNIKYQDALSQQLFINLHKINDFRRINVYFIEVNKNLKFGGYFISNGYTIKERKKKILKKYPPIINYIFYSFDFIFNRVIPKLPICKECYFAVTKGKNRAISKAEILGRLYFCGFRVINTKVINNNFYFIAQKINVPREDPNPTYGPLIKLKRVGKDGKIIYVYKIRTMHPYAEYLQNYIYQMNNLQQGGKFANDFRVSTLGKIMRKYWIDELPMLINFLKGELKIVGVRPLSVQYFRLYPEEFQELRINYKPGLIPPFYVDLPETFDEIVESEKKYLAAYDKHPFRTDIRYFCKAIYNILFKKARSK